MNCRQAGAPVTDKQLDQAHFEGLMKRLSEQDAWRDKPDVSPGEQIKCRLYPKLAFFFDGTGCNLWQELEKPVEKRALTNVAKLYRTAIDDKDEKEAAAIYIPGVGTPFRYGEYEDDPGGALGLGFGAGGGMRLDAALTEFWRLLEIEWGSGAIPHMQWITLSVFGFSRGATLARLHAPAHRHAVRAHRRWRPAVENPRWRARPPADHLSGPFRYRGFRRRPRPAPGLGR
jgi:hypothetical protein